MAMALHPLAKLQELVVHSPICSRSGDGDQDAETKALVDAVLLHAPTLVRLELKGMLIGGDNHSRQLAELSALTKLTHLDMMYMCVGHFLSEHVFGSLSTLTDLRHIGASKSYFEDPKSVIPLAHLPHLTSVDISYNDCNVTALVEWMRQSTALESLDISGNVIGPDAAADIACALPDMPRLAVLRARSSDLKGEGVMHLVVAASRHSSILLLLDLVDNVSGRQRERIEAVARLVPTRCCIVL